MKKKWILGIAALVIVSGIATACSPEEEGHDHSAMTQASSVQTVTDENGVSSIIGTATGSADEGGKPALEAQLQLEGRSATITYTVTNLKLSAENMGKKAVPGEGHLHLYVDGKEKAMLKTDAPVKLENLTAGKHTIKLTLQQNDHSSLNVEKTFNIDVK